MEKISSMRTWYRRKGVNRARSPFFFCKILENDKKVFTFSEKQCIIIRQPKHGAAPDSIAGERKDKHTVVGATTLKRST